MFSTIPCSVYISDIGIGHKKEEVETAVQGGSWVDVNTVDTTSPLLGRLLVAPSVV